MDKTFYIIEHLSLRSLILNILPLLLKRRGAFKPIEETIYFVDASRPGLIASRLILKFLRLSLKPLDFILADIRDDQNNSLRLRIAYFDLFKVQEKILANPAFKEAIAKTSDIGRLPLFLIKQIALIDTLTNAVIWRYLFLVQVAKWKAKELFKEPLTIVLFISQGVWMEEIAEYGASYGVTIVETVNTRFALKNILQYLLGPKFKAIRNIYVYLRKTISSGLLKNLFSARSQPSASAKKEPKLAVEYYGHLNLDKPELYSDLFFYQESMIASKDILATFHIPRDPLDKKKYLDLTKRGLNALAIDPIAAKGDVPTFNYFGSQSSKNIPLVESHSRETAWLNRHILNYFYEYDYWRSLFLKNNIKIYLTWFKYHALHCVMSDAINDCGGVMAIYQRAMEELPTLETAVNTDIVFGFSPANAVIESQSNSKVLYHVSVGYPGDHRFKLLKKLAQPTREKILKAGAKKIIAFFDENSSPDVRFHSGHDFMRFNYQFLLEKLLNQPWLGLVLKPKVSSTLRARLGPVALALEKAEATGRCFVFEGGTLHSSYPPAIAALVSDVTVHGHLCAATAGLEAALPGVPTLLLDREGWSLSPLYKLEKGKVVFNDWESIWAACCDHFNSKKGLPGFGDWSSIINDIDSFRDGKAAKRMGTYLYWLMQGFKAGKRREIVMAQAAERYVDIWGKDKIAEVKPCQK